MKLKNSKTDLKMLYAEMLVSDFIIPLKKVAEKAGFKSGASFSVLYKRKNNILPLKARQQAWLDRGVTHGFKEMMGAVRDVKKPFMPFENIALRHGFGNLSDFQQQFRNLTMFSPKEYRQRNWGSIMAGLSDFSREAIEILDEDPWIKHAYLAYKVGFDRDADVNTNMQMFSTYFKRDVGLCPGAYARLRHPYLGSDHMSKIRGKNSLELK